MNVIIDLIEHSIFLTKYQKYRLMDLCEKSPEKRAAIQRLLVKGEEVELQSEAVYEAHSGSPQAQYLIHQSENDIIQMQIEMRKMISKYV